MVVSQKREVFAFIIYQNSLWSYCGQRNRAKSSKSRVWGCIPATSIESFWVSHLALLCLSFLICKMGIMSPPHTQTGKVLCVMAQNLLYINYFWIVWFLFWFFFVVVVVWFFLWFCFLFCFSFFGVPCNVTPLWHPASSGAFSWETVRVALSHAF